MEKKELQAILEDMSLAEKVGQLVQLIGRFYREETKDIVTGPTEEIGLPKEYLDLVGSIMSIYGAEWLKKLQTERMEKQPHHIPVLFMMDIIHGMKTIFPAPLGQAATFEPELTRQGAEIAAKEASAMGMHVGFSPMSDLVRDPRWGRVVESYGEDPFMISRFVEAHVKGFQGENMKEPGRMCACIKHFAGYGGAEAGRDYNTVSVDRHSFKEYYLRGYQAGISAGAGMVMTSFNTVDGIPATANCHLMRNILREEMGFGGVLISDYAAIKETIIHGYSENERDAAKKCMMAGVDIDMMTSVYAKYVGKLIEKGELEQQVLDESVMRILELKNKLGLFENPYKDADVEKEKQLLMCPAHREAARKAAAHSFVLLKNEGILPVSPNKKTAFIGPYVNEKHLLSTWAFTGDADECVTIQEAAEEVFDKVGTSYLEGCPMLDPEYSEKQLRRKINQESYSYEMIEEMKAQACKKAAEADVVIMPLGEYYLLSGEATSRGMLDLPEVQLELLEAVTKVNPNVAVLVFSGRPLDLRKVSKLAKAVLEVWLPGTEGGHAIVDVLTGKVNPSGKLPMSFPYCVGQIPVYYNHLSTGRKDFPECDDHFRSRYIDIPNEPLYSFGYGLSYTKFEISSVKLDKTELSSENHIAASVTVKNVGEYAGAETLQLYIQDVTASVVRPVKELKGFQKVYLKKGESREVLFSINEEMLRFVRADGTNGSESGLFRVWIGNSSEVEQYKEFYLL